jgi:hypothetical protein
MGQVYFVPDLNHLEKKIQNSYVESPLGQRGFIILTSRRTLLLYTF